MYTHAPSPFHPERSYLIGRICPSDTRVTDNAEYNPRGPTSSELSPNTPLKAPVCVDNTRQSPTRARDQRLRVCVRWD